MTKKFQYDYPRPALAVDCVVFGLDADSENLQILLIERKLPPFAGRWALPGGFVYPDESLDEAARRELVEEAGVKNLYLEQLYTFGHPHRDPREHVVSVAYFALVKLSNHRIRAATDARSARWHPINSLPKLAFDHPEIVNVAVQRLANKVRYQPIGFELLPHKFPLRDLQRLYEILLGRSLDKRNFRKKILGMELLIPLEEVETGVTHRAARLYRFDKSKYRQLVKSGFNFEI